MNNRPLSGPWLETYHISKYVKKYDARSEAKYLSPPKIRDRLSVGDRVVISPQGRYRWYVESKHIGKIAVVTLVREFDNKTTGRACEVEFLSGNSPGYAIREINLRKHP